MTNRPNDWIYVIGKTFGIADETLFKDEGSASITETLWVEGASPQPDDIVLEFVPGMYTIYLPLVMRNYTP